MDAGDSIYVAGLSGGAASYPTSSLAAGTHSITASYLGDSHYNSGSSGIFSQVVNKVATTTTLTSDLNPATYFQTTTFLAQVLPVSGSGTATGSVTFMDGTKTLGVEALNGGFAAFTPARALGAGSHSITASYAGDPNCLKSTAALSQVINQATTSITLKSNVNPVFAGQPVTFTAVVLGQYGGEVTGFVSFYVNGQAMGSPAAVAAAYNDDPNYLESPLSNPVNEVVEVVVTTTVSLKSSLSPAPLGQPVTFTATVHLTLGGIPNGEVSTFKDGTTVIGSGLTNGGVAATTTSTLSAGSHSITAFYPGDGVYQPSTSPVFTQVSASGPTPTGTVTFKSGSSPIGTGTLSGGIATLAYTKLAAGTNSITVTYAGDTNSLGGTSAPLSQTVSEASTSTTVTSSLNPSTAGKSVTFTATVTSQYATPAGTVNFSHGSTALGTATLAGGKAKLAVTTLPVGADTVTATYIPATPQNFVGSAGSILQTVN